MYLCFLGWANSSGIFVLHFPGHFDFSINFYGKNQDEHAILGTQNIDAKLLHMCLCVCIKYSRLAYGKSAKGKEFTEIKLVNV